MELELYEIYEIDVVKAYETKKILLYFNPIEENQSGFQIKDNTCFMILGHTHVRFKHTQGLFHLVLWCQEKRVGIFCLEKFEDYITKIT